MDDCLVSRDGESARSGTKEQKTRACVNCARLKMKCQWPSSGSGRTENTCSRCARMNLDCRVPETTQRKKRGKSTRVAQLEKKIDGIVSLLAANQRKGLSPLTPESPQDTQCQPLSEESTSNVMNVNAVTSDIVGPHEMSLDSSDLELFPGFRVTHEEAAKRLSVYRQHYAPKFPFVPMPGGISTHELYAESRVLFWTIIAMVSPLPDAVQMQFKDWFRRYLAEHIVVRQEKRIDILQAILVFLAWNDFHFYGELQVTNIVQLALALIVDLRLDRPHGSIIAGPRTLLGDAWTSMGRPCTKVRNELTAQDRRAVLGVYYITTLLCSFFKKNTILPWSNHLAQCCDYLFEAREYASDLYIVAIVRMQHMCDRAFGVMPVMDGIDPTPPTFRAPMAMAMDTIQQELERFAKFQPETVKQTPGFWIHYYTLLVRLYEPVVMMKSLSITTTESFNTVPLQRSEYMWKCLEHVLSAFQSHISLPNDEVSTLPVMLNSVLAFTTVTASRLMLGDSSDWDVTLARRRLNFQDILKNLSDQFEAADEEARRLDRRRRVMEDGSSVFLKCSFKTRWIRQWYISKLPQEQQVEVPQLSQPLIEPPSLVDPNPEWAANFQFDDEFWAELMSGESLDTTLANGTQVECS
ncbi:hypothetical protein FDECE_13852 [Fusarium decemcellulare]|nr:hypothetical protein FDECE_13852 [Fusarium decemcellulare]